MLSAMTRPALLLAAILILPAPARADEDPGIRAGISSLFRLDFGQARGRFAEYIREKPESPVGYLAHGASIWWQAATEPVYGRVDDTLEKQFHADIKSAVKLAKKRFKAKDDLVRARAYLLAGLAHGLRGQWYWDQERDRKALSQAKKARRYLKKCLKYEPGNVDAAFGITLIEYYEGEREKLPGLDAAMRRGRLTSSAAAIFRLRISILDRKDYPAALPAIETLTKRYPDSLFLTVLKAVILHRLDRWKESHGLIRGVMRDRSRRLRFLGRDHPRLICGFYQHRCLEKSSLRGVVEWTSRALHVGGRGPFWDAFLRMYRGLAHDLVGDRELAELDFKRMDKHHDLRHIRRLIELCVVDRCRRKDAVKFLERMSGDL